MEVCIYKSCIMVDCCKEPLLKGRLSTLHLLVLTSLNQLIYTLNAVNITYLCYKTSYPHEEVNSTEPSLKLVLPDCCFIVKHAQHSSKRV